MACAVGKWLLLACTFAVLVEINGRLRHSNPWRRHGVSRRGHDRYDEDSPGYRSFGSKRREDDDTDDEALEDENESEPLQRSAEGRQVQEENGGETQGEKMEGDNNEPEDNGETFDDAVGSRYDEEYDEHYEEVEEEIEEVIEEEFEDVYEDEEYEDNDSAMDDSVPTQAEDASAPSQGEDTAVVAGARRRKRRLLGRSESNKRLDLDDLMPECPPRIPYPGTSCLDCESDKCKAISHSRCCEGCCMDRTDFSVQKDTGCPYSSLTRIYLSNKHLYLEECNDAEECNDGFTCCDNNYYDDGVGSSCHNNQDLWLRGGESPEEIVIEDTECYLIPNKYSCRVESDCFYGCFEPKINKITCLCIDR